MGSQEAQSIFCLTTEVRSQFSYKNATYCTKRNVSNVTWETSRLLRESDTTCDSVTNGILAVFVQLSINITKRLTIFVIPKSRNWDRLIPGFCDWYKGPGFRILGLQSLDSYRLLWKLARVNLKELFVSAENLSYFRWSIEKCVLNFRWTNFFTDRFAIFTFIN